LNFKKELDG